MLALHSRAMRLRFDKVSECMENECRRSEEHTSELQSPYDLVCRLLLEKNNERRVQGHPSARRLPAPRAANIRAIPPQCISRLAFDLHAGNHATTAARHLRDRAPRAATR